MKTPKKNEVLESDNATEVSKVKPTEDVQEQPKDEKLESTAQDWEAKYNKCIKAIKDANVSSIIGLYDL